MALLLAAVGLGAGITYMAQKQDRTTRELQALKAQAHKFVPDSGRYATHAQCAGLQQGGIPVRSFKDVDLQGVPFTFVDYGGGTFHKIYTPAAITGSTSQNF